METNPSTNIGAAKQAAIHPDHQNPKPEWLRVPQAVRTFGISRSSLYEWIAAGRIRSTCLRKRGAGRGVRLIHFDSLAAFVDQAANQGGIIE